MNRISSHRIALLFFSFLYLFLFHLTPGPVMAETSSFLAEQVRSALEETPTYAPTVRPTRTPRPTPTPRPTSTLTPTPRPAMELNIKRIINGGEEERFTSMMDTDVIVGDEVDLTFDIYDPMGGPLKLDSSSIFLPGYEREHFIEVEEGNPLIFKIKIKIPTDLYNRKTIHLDFWVRRVDQSRKSFHLTFHVQGYIPSNDYLVLAQGRRGKYRYQVRLYDPMQFDNTSYPIYNSKVGEYSWPDFGGEYLRAVYVDTGDINGDGSFNVVSSYGPIPHDANVKFPNVVISRDAFTKQLTGHSFHAFPKGDTLPVQYNQGEVRCAVGNFTGEIPEQIAAAQGFGGSGVVRIFQYTGMVAPYGYKVAAQFYGLAGPAKEKNSNGGILLAAGDVDGDGLDELIASQSFSPTSETIFHVLDIDLQGRLQKRSPYAAFPQQYRKGGAGAAITVCDINGDGQREIVAVSQDRGVQIDGQINLLSVIQPIIRDGVVQGFTRPQNSVAVVMPEAINPSGTLSITSGEYNNNYTDGDEIVIGTGENYAETGDITVDEPRMAYYKVLKIYIEDGSVRIADLNADTPSNGIIQAFLDILNPSSGVVNLSSFRENYP